MLNITSEIINNQNLTSCNCTSCDIKKPSKYYRNVLFSNSINPASQYFNQRKIQNVTGVFPSMYNSILNTLNTQTPVAGPYTQRNLSDRNQASIGKSFTPTNTLKTSWNTPNNLYAGGVGVDIKHGSYARRLNRLKAGLVIREPYPTQPGIKTKTGISTNTFAKCCNDNSTIPPDDKSMNPFHVYFKYLVGQQVYWLSNDENCFWVLAKIISIIQYDIVQVQLVGSADQTIHTVSIWNIRPLGPDEPETDIIPETIGQIIPCAACNVTNTTTYIVNELNQNGVSYYFQ